LPYSSGVQDVQEENEDEVAGSSAPDQREQIHNYQPHMEESQEPQLRQS